MSHLRAHALKASVGAAKRKLAATAARIAQAARHPKLPSRRRMHTRAAREEEEEERRRRREKSEEERAGSGGGREEG
eukprot:1474885-Rhodomonas_salina.1